MRRIVIALAMVVAFAASADAWTKTFTCGGSPSATGFKLDSSVDGGVTWAEATNPAARPAACSFAVTSAVTGTVLLRWSACNAATCSTLTTDGAWHQESAALPLPPTSVGSQ
jgi:hypothetical protein